MERYFPKPESRVCHTCKRPVSLDELAGAWRGRLPMVSLLNKAILCSQECLKSWKTPTRGEGAYVGS